MQQTERLRTDKRVLGDNNYKWDRLISKYHHYLSYSWQDITCIERREDWTDEEWERAKAMHFLSKHRKWVYGNFEEEAWISRADVASMIWIFKSICTCYAKRNRKGD